ncbi:MAG: hypothetical protein JSR58_01080 [Verrucomicrobia bacterium]|nr:hypothetical protein [Verrucomicrobiota bacterium]
MVMIAVAETTELNERMKKHLDALEKETKTKQFEGDPVAVSTQIYEKFAKQMEEEKEIKPDLRDLALNSVRGKFTSPWGAIPKDLEKARQAIFNPEKGPYTWYQLCTAN